MKQDDFTALIEYIDKWNAIEGVKPKNEPLFVVEFIKLLNNYPDDREVTFDGEGAYFGKQVTLEPFSFFGKSPRQLRFEMAYSDTLIKVYTATHDGYWNPEYLSMGKDDVNFEDVKGEVFKFLHRVFGL